MKVFLVILVFTGQPSTSTSTASSTIIITSPTIPSVDEVRIPVADIPACNALRDRFKVNLHAFCDVDKAP